MENNRKKYALILYWNECQYKQFILIWNCINQQRHACARQQPL